MIIHGNCVGLHDLILCRRIQIFDTDNLILSLKCEALTLTLALALVLRTSGLGLGQVTCDSISIVTSDSIGLVTSLQI